MAAKSQKSRRKKKASRTAVVLAVLALILFAAGGMMAYEYGQKMEDYETMREVVERDTFYAGISVGGIDLSGMTYDQALALIQEEEQAHIDSYVVTINADGREYKETLPATSNALQSLEKAYQFGRMGDMDVRYQEIQSLAVNKHDYPIEYQVDSSRLRTLVASIADEIYIAPVDATVGEFDREAKTFSFTDEVTGRQIDEEALLAEITAAVSREEYPINVTAVVNVLEPTVTREQLSAQNKLLATYMTKTTSDADRNNNIQLCAASFNGAVIMPGESFSLNEKTGLRSNDKGYKPAGAILNGKLVPELGGGVCQVSTTLFNAVVRAGVEITERNNHSYPISYVPRGMDAMIDYQSAKDFRFVNNSSGPIYLVSHFSNQELTVEVYGQPILDEGIAVELRSETTEEIPMPPTIYETDYTLMPGEMVEERTGRTGYRVTTYIQYKRGETVEKEDVLFKSVYTAYAPIVKQGPLPADGSIGYYDPSTDTPILPSGDIPILQ